MSKCTEVAIMAVYAAGMYVTVVLMGFVSPKEARGYGMRDSVTITLWPVVAVIIALTAVGVAGLTAAEWIRAHAPRCVGFLLAAFRIATLPFHPWRIGRLLAGRGWE
jgi:hypothetical protein